ISFVHLRVFSGYLPCGKLIQFSLWACQVTNCESQTTRPHTTLAGAARLQRKSRNAHSRRFAWILLLSYAIRVHLSWPQTRQEFARASCASHVAGACESSVHTRWWQPFAGISQDSPQLAAG